jgi:hypothetical protein
MCDQVTRAREASSMTRPLPLRRGRILAALLTAAGAVACSQSPTTPASPAPPPAPVTPPRTHTTLTGGICTSLMTRALPPPGVTLTCGVPMERSHMIAVGRAGTMTLNVDFQFVGEHSPNTLSVEVGCGSDIVLEKKFGNRGGESKVYALPEGIAGPVDVALPRPCDYQVRLFDFIGDTRTGIATTYRVEVDYP